MWTDLLVATIGIRRRQAPSRWALRKKLAFIERCCPKRPSLWHAASRLAWLRWSLFLPTMPPPSSHETRATRAAHHHVLCLAKCTNTTSCTSSASRKHLSFTSTTTSSQVVLTLSSGCAWMSSTSHSCWRRLEKTSGVAWRSPPNQLWSGYRARIGSAADVAFAARSRSVCHWFGIRATTARV